MFALILGSSADHATADLARPIAGAPLLVRQVEWMHSAGVRHVVINRVAQGRLPDALGGEALGELGVRATWIPSGEVLDERQLAGRGGVQGEAGIVLSHATLGNLDLAPLLEEAGSSHANLSVSSGGASVRIVAREELGEPASERASSGWLSVINSESRAQELTEALLMGEVDGVVVRGTEVAPGIWKRRGAVVVDGAKLVAPCLLGPYSFVADKATAGPGAILGERAVLESRAVLEHGRVEDGVIVGQGVRISEACVIGGTIVRHEGRSVSIEDPLLLDRDESTSRVPRLLAALALGTVAPLSVVAGEPVSTLCRRLARVVDGHGQWVGVRDESDEDGVVLDVLPVLVPPRAEEEERLAARALYAAKKGFAMDAKLIAGRLFGGTENDDGED